MCILHINCILNKPDGNPRGIHFSFLHIPCQSQPGFLDNVVHRLGSQTILAHRTGDSVKNKNAEKNEGNSSSLWLNQPILKIMHKSNWIISPYRDANLKNIFELPPPSQTTPLVDLWPTNKNLVGPLGAGTWFNSLAGGGPEGGFGPLFAFASLFVARLSDSFGIGNHFSVFGYPLLAWRQNVRNTRSISGFAFVATSGVIPEDLGAFGIGFAFTFPSPFLLAHVSFCYHHFLSHFLHVIFGRRLPILVSPMVWHPRLWLPVPLVWLPLPAPCQSSEDHAGGQGPQTAFRLVSLVSLRHATCNDGKDTRTCTSTQGNHNSSGLRLQPNISSPYQRSSWIMFIKLILKKPCGSKQNLYFPPMNPLLLDFVSLRSVSFKSCWLEDVAQSPRI